MTMSAWNCKPTSHARRRFIELIYHKTGKRVNWNPPSGVLVGSYGRINRNTDNFIVEGNIYDDEFKENLIRLGIDIANGEHRPEEYSDEVDFSAWSENMKKLEMNTETHADIPGMASATTKGIWEVKKGTTGAILLMHNPRIKRISDDTLGKVAGITLLRDKYIVTKVYYCPAFSMYLSDKSGEKISLALLGSAPVAGPSNATGGVSMTWWSNTLVGILRHGCKPEYCFTPLYDLKHIRTNRRRR